MDQESKVVWRDGMAFDAHIDGFSFIIDADEQFGGRNLGPRPKALTLTSLAGCTAMDVVAILSKMRVEITGLEVSAEADLAEEHPKSFTRAVLTYTVTGDEVPQKKLLRAVALSEERYCGVRATLAPVVEIRSEVYLNGERIDSSPTPE